VRIRARADGRRKGQVDSQVARVGCEARPAGTRCGAARSCGSAGVADARKPAASRGSAIAAACARAIFACTRRARLRPPPSRWHAARNVAEAGVYIRLVDCAPQRAVLFDASTVLAHKALEGGDDPIILPAAAFLQPQRVCEMVQCGPWRSCRADPAPAACRDSASSASSSTGPAWAECGSTPRQAMRLFARPPGRGRSPRASVRSTTHRRFRRGARFSGQLPGVPLVVGVATFNLVRGGSCAHRKRRGKMILCPESWCFNAVRGSGDFRQSKPAAGLEWELFPGPVGPPRLTFRRSLRRYQRFHTWAC